MINTSLDTTQVFNRYRIKKSVWISQADEESCFLQIFIQHFVLVLSGTQFIFFVAATVLWLLGITETKADILTIFWLLLNPLTQGFFSVSCSASEEVHKNT